MNLNLLRKKNELPETNDKIKVYFENLEGSLLKHLSEASYVLGCVAWLTNNIIIQALQKLKGVKIIVNKEEFLSRKMKKYQQNFYQNLRNSYDTIPDILRKQCLCCKKEINQCCKFNKLVGKLENKEGAILTCGIVNYSSRMHHKFLILFNDEFNPIGVWTGSYNFSKNSNNSFENAIYITDISVITKYINEFLSIYCLSEKYDWESGTLIVQ